jgi:hypothetical protein
MTARKELLKEARRCAYEASRGVSPGMFRGLSKFYTSLAASEPQSPPREHRNAQRREPERQDRHATAE